MKIKNKIVTNTVAISCILVILSIICLIWQANKLGQRSLFSLQKDRLTSIRYFKTLEIEAYFNNLLENISILATNREIINGLEDFSKTFPRYLTEAVGLNSGYKSEIINKYLDDFSLKYKYYNGGKTIDPRNLVNLLSENSFALQYNYIFNTKYDLSNKDQINTVIDGTNYSLMHAKHHPSILAYKQQFGFYDILLVDGNNGNIVYTVNKELDFTTSLINGPYSQSNLAEVFKKIMASEQQNFITIADFAPYLAFYDNPAAFIGIAVHNETGKKIGAMIIQISIEKINTIMSNKEQWDKIGLGNSINTSIVGADFKLRTNNRFFLENAIGFLKELQKSGTDQNTIDLIRAKNSLIGILTTDTVAVRQSFSGIEGFAEYIDYRKVPVISSFAPLNIPGLNWAIVVKMNKAEALNWISLLKKQIILNGFVIAIVLSILAALLGKRVSKNIISQIYNLTNQINTITQTKDLTKRLTEIKDNEFSTMVNAFNNFIENLQTYLKNIIAISQKSNSHLLDQAQQQSNLMPQDPKDLEITKDLYEQIHNLSQEFKIIEQEQERTKYW